LLTAAERQMSETPGSARYDAVVTTPDAQSQFVSENMRRVFLLIYRVVGNVADAQDLTQEAFIKALQRQDQLKDLDKAAHWLSRIASNTAIDFLRRSGRVSFSELDAAPEPVAVSSADSPEQILLRAERRESLEASLDILTDRERTALLLRDVEDLSAEEVAEHLNCSKATVRSHIANARVKLRKHFDRLHKRGMS
jgi:RNA polymerase sigma-70 factor, ECF subfamily